MKLKDLIASTPQKYRADLIWLLSFQLQISKTDIFLQPDRVLSSTELKKIKSAMLRRKGGEPLQYIVKSAPFYGREFYVRPGVLIPRPETEVLVQLALDSFPVEKNISVLDLCTGSGVVGITLKLERPHWKILATDISLQALSVAKKNSQLLNAQIDIQKHDLYSKKLKKEKFDLVISNPPYLDFKKDKIMADVKKWEPKIALEPTMDAKIKNLKERAAWMGEKILLSCEQNCPQYTLLELSPRIASFLEKRWRKNSAIKNISCLPDLTGRKRFLLVTWQHG